jgi:hypothetical protein
VSINWSTVATAVVTAAFVALVVEYLAKPRMEARKQRILDAHQTRRELQALITTLSIAAGRYLERLPEGADSELQEVWEAERERRYEIKRSNVELLADEVPRLVQSYLPKITADVIAYALCIHAVTLSLRTKDRKAEIVAGFALPITNALNRPSIWEMRSWEPTWPKVRAMIAEVSAQAETPPAPHAMNRALQLGHK